MTARVTDFSFAKEKSERSKIRPDVGKQDKKDIFYLTSKSLLF